MIKGSIEEEHQKEFRKFVVLKGWGHWVHSYQEGQRKENQLAFRRTVEDWFIPDLQMVNPGITDTQACKTQNNFEKEYGWGKMIELYVKHHPQERDPSPVPAPTQDHGGTHETVGQEPPVQSGEEGLRQTGENTFNQEKQHPASFEQRPAYIYVGSPPRVPPAPSDHPARSNTFW
jgi:hypothetical protein